jgi:hypothetical protein
MSACDAHIAMALFACLAEDPRCLPQEHGRHLPKLMAIAEQEPSFHPFAIRDETTSESLFPATRGEAVALATARDLAGHRLEPGWFQITH